MDWWDVYKEYHTSAHLFEVWAPQKSCPSLSQMYLLPALTANVHEHSPATTTIPFHFIHFFSI